jgi:hypothetical protein
LFQVGEDIWLQHLHDTLRALRFRHGSEGSDMMGNLERGTYSFSSGDRVAGGNVTLCVALPHEERVLCLQLSPSVKTSGEVNPFRRYIIDSVKVYHLIKLLPKFWILHPNPKLHGCAFELTRLTDNSLPAVSTTHNFARFHIKCSLVK